MGCGRPPNSFCGGDASTICSTPAIWAGTTFITTELGSTALPPGTYRPTRRIGTQRWVTVPPGTTSTRCSGRVCAASTARTRAADSSRADADLGIELRKGSLQLRTGDPQVLRSHSVEALGGILHRVRAAGGDVLDDGPHGGDRGLDIQLGARQGCGELRGAQAARTRRSVTERNGDSGMAPV